MRGYARDLRYLKRRIHYKSGLESKVKKPNPNFEHMRDLERRYNSWEGST